MDNKKIEYDGDEFDVVPDYEYIISEAHYDTDDDY